MGKHWYCRLLLWGTTLGQMILGAACPVWADSEFISELRAVPDAELAQMRGGYTSAAGVEVAFGIESAVFIDGILQAVTSFNSVSSDFNLPDPRVIVNTGVNSTVGLELVKSQLAVGSMDAEAVRSQLITVVQNNQDHKIIDNIIQLNAIVSSLDVFRQNRIFDSFQQQMIDARH